MDEEDLKLGSDVSEDECVNVEDDSVQGMEGGTDPNLSALRHNIKSKGKNSYYYAHGTKVDGPVWDKKPEPRLLAREEGVTTKTVDPEAITSYAWLDETEKVK